MNYELLDHKQNSEGGDQSVGAMVMKESVVLLRELEYK